VATVVQQGLSNALDKILFPNINDDGHHFDAFFASINHIANTIILGTADNPSQWECPCDRTCHELGIICLDNMKTHKFVNGINSFLDFCIVDEQDRLKWKHCISKYKNAMLLMCQKCDLTNNDIKRFQQHVDTFYVSWIDLLLHEGITNYIHMIGAGHIGEYLLHHHNLYKHSKQGWAVFNSLLKTFFFHCTGRGGAGNKGTGAKSKILPIARWLLCCMLWMMGYDCNCVLQELYHDVVHNDFESDSNDNSSVNSEDYDSDSHSCKDSHDFLDTLDNGML